MEWPAQLFLAECVMLLVLDESPTDVSDDTFFIHFLGRIVVEASVEVKIEVFELTS